MKQKLSSASWFSFPRLLACACILALALRVGLALALPEKLYWPDSNWYFRVAERLASGQGFGASLARAPLYPYFLSAILLFTSRLLVVRICESILSALACAIVGIVGRRFFSERVGLLAAFVCAIYPYFIYLPSAQGSDNIVTFLLLVSVLFLAGNVRGFSLGNSLLSGLFLGLSYLGRPSLMGVVPGMAVWALFWPRAIGTPWLRRTAFIVIVASMATVAPWTVRNYVATGNFVLIATGGGRQFWYGNSYFATGSTTENPEYPQELKQRLAALPDEPSREKLLYREGFKFIGENPGSALKLYVRKLANLFQLYPSVHTSNILPRSGLARILGSAASLLLFVLASVGAVLVFVKRNPGTLLPCVVVSYCLVSAVFLTVMRYRLPVDPYVILLACVGLASFLRWPSGLNWRE
ncbi:MAG: glycosyltransferase family 39 protein [Candidatus Eiseniibacteriota bacterium]|nr:MAG: glycosyltransferase family 39 protein [Candidatus Eisenbacteria bacterium]